MGNSKKDEPFGLSVTSLLLSSSWCVRLWALGAATAGRRWSVVLRDFDPGRSAATSRAGVVARLYMEGGRGEGQVQSSGLGMTIALRCSCCV